MPQDLIKNARRYIFSSGVEDSGTSLCQANLQYGLAKIHFVQKQLGLKPNAFFIGAPDMTTPRYIPKWEWGLGIGGTLIWGDGKEKLVFLDPRVGPSGVFVGGLKTAPDPETLLKRIVRLKAEKPTIMGAPIIWDLDRGNHFINLYRVVKNSDGFKERYLILIHGSDPEMQQESVLGMGLHYDKSKTIKKKMQVIDTPLGPVRFLHGKDANDYYRFYRLSEEFSKAKRQFIAEKIFGQITYLSNVTHHGFANPNQILLGCYTFRDGERTLFPLTLRAELKAYLVRGRKNLSLEALRTLGLEKLAKSCGLLTYLKSANILPHGGGYTYPEIQKVKEVIVLGNRRYFLISTSGHGMRIIENVGSLPYVYRGLEVLQRVLQLQMAEVIAELETIYSLTV